MGGSIGGSYMRKTFKPIILLLTSLLLAGCNFKFQYNVKGITTDIEGGSSTEWDSGIDDAGSYKIKIWVAETVESITNNQVTSFKAQHPEFNLDVTIAKMDEPEAATQMKKDVANGADIYCFAQDQLANLKKSNALAKMPASLTKVLSNINSDDSMKAATIDGDVWAMPATSDNGYFLYYDKSVLSEADVEDLDTLLAKAQSAGKKFFYDAQNGYYNAGFFLGAGCENSWETNKSGRYVKYNDTFNSENGVKAAKALRTLVNSTAWRNGNTVSRFEDIACAVVSGIWDYKVAQEILGDKLGCTDLPSYTVDGQTYHLGSYDGYKLFGVKPQTDAKKMSVCRKLALYLAGEEGQRARFNLQSWGPTNKVVAADPRVMEHPALAALAKQHEFATIQGQCPGAWFNALTALEGEIKNAATDDAIRAALQTYYNGLEALLDED